jgi:ABC-type nitrate/sulfonate/bicarbonate transport system permease component
VTPRILAPVAGLAAVVGAWEALVRVAGLAPYELPAPSRVAWALVDTRDLLVPHLRATAGVALLGLSLGAVAGVVIGAALAIAPLLRAMFQPLLVASQSVPAVVLAPVFIVWFGFGLLPRLLVVTLVVLFPVAVATADGLADADPELVDLIAANGGSRWDVLQTVRAPHTLGTLFAGLRIAASYAMFAAVVAEYMGGAEHGLGLYLLRSQRSFRNDQAFAAIVVIAAASVLLHALVVAAGRLATPWRSPDRAVAR